MSKKGNSAAANAATAFSQRTLAAGGAESQSTGVQQDAQRTRNEKLAVFNTEETKQSTM